jgi:hypothetical protein
MPRGAIMRLNFDMYFQTLAHHPRSTSMACRRKLWKTQQPSALAKGIAAIPLPAEKSNHQTKGHAPIHALPVGRRRIGATIQGADFLANCLTAGSPRGQFAGLMA